MLNLLIALKKSSFEASMFSLNRLNNLVYVII